MNSKILAGIVAIAAASHSSTSMANGGRGVFNVLSGKGAYAVCVDKTNKKDSQWLEINGEDKYFNRHWRSFKTDTEVVGLFYPDLDKAYYQSTWVMPVTQGEYTELVQSCESKGSNYVPQPYSKHGWYLFAIVDDGNVYGTRKVELNELKAGFVTPFWWNGSSWVKSLPGYVKFFSPEDSGENVQSVDPTVYPTPPEPNM